MAVTADANGIYCDNGTYSFADIYATAGIGGVDFLQVDSGTGYRTYRSLKTIFIGQTVSTGTGTTNATTFADTNCMVTFDSGKFFRTRTGTTSTIEVTLGTKVGSGTVASGGTGVVMSFVNAMTMSIRGTVKLYGVVLKSSGTGTRALQIANASTGNTSEIMNCVFDGWSNYVFGSSGSNISSIYNLDLYDTSTGNPVTSFFVDAAERMTFASTTCTNFISSSTAGLQMKDVAFFGNPSIAHLSAGGASPNWVLVRPVWIDGEARFNVAGASGGADNSCHEYWIYDVKCVDGAGTGVSGIPVRLTDAQGNVQVDTTTDSAGEITFGSGLTTKAVIVMDHYMVSSVYTQRSRSPFLVEINMSYQTGYNRNYYSHRYYMTWPGAEGVTTTAGSFEDVGDIIQMSAPSAGGSTWTEVIVP